MTVAAPTPFPALNAVLAAFVDGVVELLGANVAGVYLQGSFALGDGDEASDVDFVVITWEDVAEADRPRLDALHGRLHDRAEQWAQHLEGSYAPAAVLRTLDGPRDVPGRRRALSWRDPAVAGGGARRYPFWFLENGGRALVRSEHDNTAVVRTVLRERGIPLFGPPAAAFVDPVDPEALRDEVRTTLAAFGGELLSGRVPLDVLWLQGFTVLYCCRALYTLATGEVASKPAAARWACDVLDPRWAALIERALSQRRRYPRGHGAPAAHAALRPEPGDAAATVEFVRYALARANVDARA